MEMEDAELIRSYVKTGSEDAFAELVSRYVDMVYSTASRQVGHAQLAEEVSQNVFTLLARKAPALTQFKSLGGWLHRATCFIAAQTIRAEMRRRQRERLAAVMNESATDSDCWEQIAPQLDIAINQLSSADRMAIVARFLQSKSIREVAGALNVSEEAAKKRIARAVEKLHRTLSGRGLAVSSTALATLLLSRAAEAAPHGLSRIITASAVPGVSTLSLFQICVIM